MRVGRQDYHGDPVLDQELVQLKYLVEYHFLVRSLFAAVRIYDQGDLISQVRFVFKDRGQFVHLSVAADHHYLVFRQISGEEPVEGPAPKQKKRHKDHQVYYQVGFRSDRYIRVYVKKGGREKARDGHGSYGYIEEFSVINGDMQ